MKRGEGGSTGRRGWGRPGPRKPPAPRSQLRRGGRRWAGPPRQPRSAEERRLLHDAEELLLIHLAVAVTVRLCWAGGSVGVGACWRGGWGWGLVRVLAEGGLGVGVCAGGGEGVGGWRGCWRGCGGADAGRTRAQAGGRGRGRRARAPGAPARPAAPPPPTVITPAPRPPSIISCSSSSVMFSPSSLATRLRFLKEILPVSSSSNRLRGVGEGMPGERGRRLGVGAGEVPRCARREAGVAAGKAPPHMQGQHGPGRVRAGKATRGAPSSLPSVTAPPPLQPHRKAFMISSRLSRSPILAVIICWAAGGVGGH